MLNINETFFVRSLQKSETLISVTVFAVTVFLYFFIYNKDAFGVHKIQTRFYKELQ